MIHDMMSRKRNRGVTAVEYGIIISLLSATAWAVFATWRIWGWGYDDLDDQTGRGQMAIAEATGITEEMELVRGDGEDPVTTTTATTTTTVQPEPSWTNDGGEFTVDNVTSQTRVSVRYMGANAGLAPWSSCWMRVRHADGTFDDVQLTTTNEGAARTVVSDYLLEEGDKISFFEKIKPKPWSNSYYNFQNDRGRLTDPGTGNNNDKYYNVFSTESDGPNQVTTVTHYAEGAAGNIFGHDEYHIGFEDLASDWSGCDRDYNDAEIRVCLVTI